MYVYSLYSIYTIYTVYCISGLWGVYVYITVGALGLIPLRKVPALFFTSFVCYKNMEQPDPTGSPPPAYNPAPDIYAQVISNGPINAPRPE